MTTTATATETAAETAAATETTRRKRDLSSRLTVEQILTERDIAPNACLFISMPVTDGSSAGDSFTRRRERNGGRGETHGDTRNAHTRLFISRPGVYPARFLENV